MLCVLWRRKANEPREPHRLSFRDPVASQEIIGKTTSDQNSQTNDVRTLRRHYPAVGSFERSTRSLSSFLFPLPSLLLSEASTRGDIALLDLIWTTKAEDRRPGWSLTNYLRSDPQYHRWQFAKSLQAAEAGDLLPLWL
jgi:hypothetical protein